ncbi:MAG: glucokinase [Pseudomonadota bacterium]
MSPTVKAVVGDVGGTNARFAVADRSEAGALVLHHPQQFAVSAFGSFEEALRAYITTLDDMPDLAAFALAGPKRGDTVRMTNVDWSVSERGLEKAFGLSQVQLVNDFGAMARGVTVMSDESFGTVLPGTFDPSKPIAVLGPGTGLGVAGILPGQPPTILSTEGGHTGFSPASALEDELLAFWRARIPFVSAETLISGPGLFRIYAALCEIEGVSKRQKTEAEVVAAAQADASSVSRRAAVAFCAMLGTFAANTCLTLGAGSVVLAGGVTRHVAPFMAESPFATRFRERGESSAYLADVPVRRIRARFAPLYGAAAMVLG